MSKKGAVKAAKETINVLDFRIWCEHCSIRIAPNEGRVALKNKTYHEGCYAKLKTHAGDEK